MDDKKKEKIYVLHEYGSNSHYNSLSYLCEEHNIKLVYREFRFLHLIGSGIKHHKLSRIIKQPKNAFFLLNLIFTKGKKVVLGMYPYDKRLPILSFLLRNHRVFYHTSYTTWFPEEMEKTKNVSGTFQIRLKKFINNQVEHIFAVTSKTKKSLCSFTGVNPNKVSIVYHSYRKCLEMGDAPSLNNYIYIGRMEAAKGIDEICDYFANHPKLNLTLIGDGHLVPLIKQYIEKYDNIKYIAYIKGLDKLKKYYQENAYFILNSKRTKVWEELFGQVVIEAMSCGCVPICSNHSGPQEIVTDGVNGFLYKESDFVKVMNHVVDTVTIEEYESMRDAAFLRGHEFESSKIANNWIKVLD